MRPAILLLGLVCILPGCGSALTINVETRPEVQQWRQKITDAVNEHDDRLKALEQEETDG